MGNIPFMPQRNILICRYSVAFNQAGHTADTFTAHRVALMRHSRGALLLRAEIFFCFPHFGSLEMTYFQSHLCQSSCNDSQGGHVHSMAVTLYHLSGNQFRLKAQFLAYVLFYKRINIRIGAYGAGELTYGNFFLCPLHTFNVAESF